MTLAKQVSTINFDMLGNKFTRYINMIVSTSHLNNR